MRNDASEMPAKGGMVFYRAKDKRIELQVTLKDETVWLTQKQIADLFGVQRPAISKHFHNIFKTRELESDSVCSILEHTASDGKVYKTAFYNLDVIISVGYRVNSARATQFRIWATQVLRNHLIEGYTLNEKRLTEQTRKIKEIQQALKLIGGIKDRKAIDHQEALGLLEVVHDYSYALELLDDYDHGRIKISQTSNREVFRISYETAVKAIFELKNKFAGSAFFGKEKDESFRSSVAAIYQTFQGKDLYPSIEEKAAHLLYFVVKNHSFIDGNKRIAASMFLWFLEKNRLLYRRNREKRIADNALVALTLMIAESDPAEKDTIAKVIVNLINRNN